jgi:hypothetical protein
LFAATEEWGRDVWSILPRGAVRGMRESFHILFHFVERKWCYEDMSRIERASAPVFTASDAGVSRL